MHQADQDADAVQTTGGTDEADAVHHAALTRRQFRAVRVPMEDGEELNDEDKGEVFFVLKTVITSLCT